MDPPRGGWARSGSGLAAAGGGDPAGPWARAETMQACFWALPLWGRVGGLPTEAPWEAETWAEVELGGGKETKMGVLGEGVAGLRAVGGAEGQAGPTPGSQTRSPRLERPTLVPKAQSAFRRQHSDERSVIFK